MNNVIFNKKPCSPKKWILQGIIMEKVKVHTCFSSADNLVH